MSGSQISEEVWKMLITLVDEPVDPLKTQMPSTLRLELSFFPLSLCDC